MSSISTQVAILNNTNNKSSNVEDGNYPNENGGHAMVVDDQERVHEEPLTEGNSKKYMVMVRNRSSPSDFKRAGGNSDIIDEGGVKYMECLKNHAAAIGGNARDGCGEFMPSGEEGTLEALKCSACHCHRNFHRKLPQGVSPEVIGYPTGTLIITPKATLEQRKISYKNGIITNQTSDSDDGKESEGLMALKRPCQQAMKKRFRTKFTPQQKEKMFNFAEKAGWKIQKLDDSVIHQFCQELGIKRRVLKVWMHNNKHNSAKKSSPTT